MPVSPLDANHSSGSRRLTPSMLAMRDQADAFTGVQPGSAKPLRYLAAFQEAEPYLALPPQTFKLVSWLIKQTMACDWEQGSRPICWPSAARQAEFLGLSPARVKALNRTLYEAGIFILRDSETGKRYGRRGPDGRIVEAYGFDLSPLAVRHTEFIRLAAEARLERDRMRALKKRATIARRAIRQVGETLDGLGPLPPGWPQLAADTALLVASIRRAATSAALTPVAQALESRKLEAEAWLREASNIVKNNPEGLADEPHTISTNKPIDPKDTVVAGNDSSCGAAASENTPFPTSETFPNNQEQSQPAAAGPFAPVERIRPAELLDLAPRLAAHVLPTHPDWRDLVDAAGAGLCHDLGVSKSLWGEACLTLGREVAAVALALVSTKPAEYFTRGAGGYFAAMVKRAKKGELHLDRSLWKLRRDKWGHRLDAKGRLH